MCNCWNCRNYGIHLRGNETIEQFREKHPKPAIKAKMIKATFYVEHTGTSPKHFEDVLSRRLEGWTHLTGVGCWHSVKEYCQTYTIIFDDYPNYKLDLRYLSHILESELTQESVLVTIETVEVL